MNYKIWEPIVEPGVCVLKPEDDVYNLGGIIDEKNYYKKFPNKATFKMDKDFPDETKLADQLKSGGNWNIVTKRVLEVMKEMNEQQVEFLPVNVLNLKDELCGEEYFFVNPLKVVDFIDIDASDLLWSTIDNQMINGVYLLEAQKTFSTELTIFRPRHLLDTIVVTEEFANEMQSHGFSGLDFMDIDEFTI